MSDFASISLLYPGAPDIHNRPAPPHLATDLNIRRLVRSIALNPGYEDFTTGVLLQFTTDLDTITYRQEILQDLLDNPDLVTQMMVLLQEVETLEGYLTAPQWKENILRQVAWRLSELQRYVDTVASLHTILEDAQGRVKSAGFKRLHDHLSSIMQGEIFRHLQSQLPELLPKIRDIRSITIGINLDLDLRPLSATLLETHSQPFVNETLISRLLGTNRVDALTSNSSLHDARHISGLQPSQVELRDRNSPFMPQLFRDLSELMDDTSKPIVKALKQYTQINSQELVALKKDIAFYLGVVQAIQRVQDAGLPMTQPAILPVEARAMQLKGMFNINLFFQRPGKEQHNADIVANDVEFGADGRIFILTGPNHGGKTTYTTAIGLVQLMAQAGIHVPAEYAEVSPVDSIYTHFATEERPNLEAGRLGEEAQRLNEIFENATNHSLVLLNESLASTSPSESLYLAKDVIRAFRLLGARVIFATHLHELAVACETINDDVDGDSRVISVVSQVQTIDDGQTIKRTYKVIPAEPNNRSYALELAARFGISFEQLKQTIKRNL